MINKAIKRSASFKLFYNQVTYNNSWRNTWRIFDFEKANFLFQKESIRNSIINRTHDVT